MEWEGECVCLPHVAADEPAEPAHTLVLSPGETPDWGEVDRLLTEGDVHILFDAGRWDERFQVERSDTGPSRLVLDGQGHASVAGIHTGYEDLPRDRVTVRRFEVPGSRDKGIYWRAGSGVILELNEVHDNRGSPSINLDYSNRSGLQSSSFIVRNNHVWDQRGECIYIGGSEGEDQDSHLYVEVRGNLVHDCLGVDGKADGINIKDRIGEVWVAHNVTANTDWGIEAASPGLYEHNVVLRSRRNGLQLVDAWAPGLDGLVFVDTVVLEPGENGVRIGSERVSTEQLLFQDLIVSDPADFALMAGGDVTVVVEGVTLYATDEPTRDWGGVTWEFSDQSDVEQALDISEPAGPDGVFFTGDEPWMDGQR